MKLHRFPFHLITFACLSAMLLAAAPMSTALAAPDLAVNKNSVDLGTIVGSATDTSVYVYNAGTACFDWEISSTEECWLTVVPAAGSNTTTCAENDYLEIQVDPSCLVGQPGQHTGTFRVTRSAQPPTDYENIQVTFDYQPPPDLEVNKNTVSLGQISGPVSDTSVYVYNAGTGSFDWTVTESVGWLTVSPMSGTTTAEHDTLTIDVDTSALAPGPRSNTFTVTRDGAPADSETVTVSFDYQPLVADLKVNKNTLALGTINGVTVNSSLRVTNAGTGTLAWTVTESVAWMTVDPMSGTTTTEQDGLTVTVDPTSLAAGPYSDTFTVTQDGVPADSETVTVSFTYAGANTAPVLTLGDVAPDSGINSTSFTYTVHYYDGDGDPAANKRVYIDGVVYAMTLQTGTAADGTYQYQTTGADLGPGSHKYYFSFTDGQGGTARLPVSGTLAGPTVDFEDVDSDYWCHDEVIACVDVGIVGGYPDGLYHPEIQVTREQMAVFISRALAGGDANVPAGPATATFDDVPTDYWAYDYVEYCVAEGVVQGFTPTTYGPLGIVNRAQMAVFIARAFDLLP